LGTLELLGKNLPVKEFESGGFGGDMIIDSIVFIKYCCEACYWLVENGAHHANPEVSALVTDSATGDFQAGNSGAQIH